ncbi:MAG TPA: hypothetical protein VNJ07_03880 [Chitinophagales bacterium]|nr:hypothetical protein [Chitinophagales bacterium]
MKTNPKTIYWICGIIVSSAVSFIIGMLIFRQIGYDEGVRFAVTSGSRQGYSLGFEMGYQLRDSIAKIENALKAADRFNLSIIEEEVSNPKAHIVITGEVLQKESKTGIAEKYVQGIAISNAGFARYTDIEVHVKFLDRRNSVLGEKKVTLNDILYPGRKVIFEIPSNQVPEFTEVVEMSLDSAQGID